MMYIYYHKKTGEIKMICKQKIIAPAFNYIKKTLTDNDIIELRRVDKIKTVKNGKINI